MSNTEANPDLRAGIVAATAIALHLAQTAGQDLSLGGDANAQAIASAWNQVLIALRESPTPDPEEPGSVEEWERRKPIIQGMVDTIHLAEEALRSGQVGGDICRQLALDLQQSQMRLHWKSDGATSEINFSSSPLNLDRAWSSRERAAGQAYGGKRASASGGR